MKNQKSAQGQKLPLREAMQKEGKAVQNFGKAVQKIGLHLQEQAQRQQLADGHLFARFAFGRYYYACFFMLSGMLMQIDPKWFSKPGDRTHGGCPKRIDNQIVRLKTAIDKTNASDPSSASKELLDSLNTTLVRGKEIKELIQEAYKIRIKADYDHQTNVEYNVEYNDKKDQFFIGPVSLDEAKEWCDQAEMFASLFLESLNEYESWREINE